MFEIFDPKVAEDRPHQRPSRGRLGDGGHRPHDLRQRDEIVAAGCPAILVGNEQVRPFEAQVCQPIHGPGLHHLRSSQRLQNLSAERHPLEHARIADVQLLIGLIAVIAGTPEVEPQALQSMVHLGSRRQVFGERRPLMLPPADRIGEPTDRDREKIDPRVDVLPDGHAPPFPTGRDVGGGHAGTVEEFPGRVLAPPDRSHRTGNNAVEIAPVGGISLGLRQWLQALEHEVR